MMMILFESKITSIKTLTHTEPLRLILKCRGAKGVLVGLKATVFQRPDLHKYTLIFINILYSVTTDSFYLTLSS